MFILFEDPGPGLYLGVLRSGYEVHTNTLQEDFDLRKIEIGSAVEAGTGFATKGKFLTPFLLNAALTVWSILTIFA